MIYLLKYFSITLLYCIISLTTLSGKDIAHPQNTDTLNITDSNSIKQGWWRTYFKSGKIKEEGKYTNNNKEGIWISYYESGHKKSEINYIRNKARGAATLYYENGQIREKGNWELDHWVGKYQYYYESGQISYNWNYNKDGRREGEQLYFYENGNKKYAGVWNDGKTDGKLLVYNEEGRLIQEKIYADGKINTTNTIKEKPVSTAATPEENNANNDIPRLKFQATGNHTIINENGKITAKGFFVKGSLFNGEKFNYDDLDKLISITYYKNGKITETKANQQNL